MLTRFPFTVWVAAATALAAAITLAAFPGRVDLAVGVAAGSIVAGGFAALAITLMTRIRRRGGDQAVQSMLNVYLGLMLARMIGYLAFVTGVVLLGAGDPLAFSAGLIAGTLIFQGLEVAYLRKLS